MDYFGIKNELVEVQKNSNKKNYRKFLIKNLSTRILVFFLIYVLYLKLNDTFNFKNKIGIVLFYFKDNNLSSDIKNLIIPLMKTTDGKIAIFFTALMLGIFMLLCSTIQRKKSITKDVWPFINKPFNKFKYIVNEGNILESKVKYGVLEWTINKYDLSNNYEGGFFYFITGLRKLNEYNQKLEKLKYEDIIDYKKYLLDERLQQEQEEKVEELHQEQEEKIEKFKDYERLDEVKIKLKLLSFGCKIIELMKRISIVVFIVLVIKTIVEALFLSKPFKNDFFIKVIELGMMSFVLTINISIYTGIIAFFISKECIVLEENRIIYEWTILFIFKIRKIFEKDYGNYFEGEEKIGYHKGREIKWYEITFYKKFEKHYNFKPVCKSKKEMLELCNFLNDLLKNVPLEKKVGKERYIDVYYED